MNHFIDLTLLKDGTPMYVNVGRIDYLFLDQLGQTALRIDQHVVTVKESFNEVKRKIDYVNSLYLRVVTV